MDDSDERTADTDRSGTTAFVSALRVRRNAIVGFGIGAIFATLVFARYAYLPDRRYGLAYWLGLAVVLAVGVGLLLTVCLTLVRTYRLARRL